MKIKATYKGKKIEIEIPDPEYWIKRNKAKNSKYWSNADNLEKRMKKEFKQAYKELEKELYRYFGKYGKDNTLTYTQKHIIAIMKELKPHIDELYDYQQISLTDLLIDTYSDNYLATLFMISEGTKIYSSFVGLNETAIKKAISYPWNGVSFSSEIWQDKNYLIYKLRNTITQGLIQGNSVDEMTKNLWNEIISKKTGKKIYKGDIGESFSACKRLIQTETGTILTASDKIAYEEFGIDEYEYIATLDNRTSEPCRELDGKVFNTEDMVIGVNAPPVHANCRSTTAAYFSYDTGKRIARNINSGKVEYVDSKIKYEDWVKKYID